MYVYVTKTCLSLRVLHFQDGGLIADGGEVHRERLEGLSVELGRGLEYAGAIDDERVAMDGGLEGAHDLIDLLGVDRGAKNPPFVGGTQVSDGDHEMGKLSVSQEDVTDVSSPNRHLLEPALVRVALSLKLVGTDIAHLQSLGVDHPEVHESPDLTLERGEVARERLPFQQLVEAMGRGDEAQRRLALGQEHLEGSPGVVHSNAQGLDGLETHGLLVLVAIDQSHQKERHQGDQHHQDDQVAAQLLVTPGGFPVIGEVHESLQGRSNPGKALSEHANLLLWIRKD